ncbi:MAG: beta-ketoacyl-ACP synthase II [Acidobacteriota bacterium]
MNNRKRVVVTGVGLVTPLGLNREDTWNSVLAGNSGVAEITRFDASEFSTRFAAEVKGFDPAVFLGVKDARKIDRFMAFAIVASNEALEHAGLKTPLENGDRAGVIIGSGIGGFETIEREVRKFITGGPRKISPFFIPAAIINEASGQVSIRAGAAGPNSATVTACAAGSHAIGDSYRIIQRGEADIMITGGAEAPITPLGVGGFAALRAISSRNDDPERASRPFDRDRDGFVVGEGAGILILEELESALKRGAPILAEMVGHGMSGDAFHITLPPEDGRGIIRAMQLTLDEAGMSPDQVDYINAHGTSTIPNDRIETAALKKVFGDHSRKLLVSSTKSMTGHLLGAAGGLEAGLSVLAIRDQVAPPTTNLENPDPDCDLDYVPNEARKAVIRSVLSNSFGFGGTNATLMFRIYDGE